MENGLMKIGEVFLIKDGKVITNNLHTTAEQLEINGSNLQFNCIMPVNGIEESVDWIHYYRSLVDNGYSIIRIGDQFAYKLDSNCSIKKIEKSFSQIDCFIAPNITDDDCDTIYQIFSTLDNQNNTPSKHIYNYFYDDNNKIDYDYLDISQTNKNYSMSEKLSILLREKINLLTNNEKRQIKEYRIYDLENILTHDFYSNKINHGNAGIIVITPHNIYQENLTKLQHGASIHHILVTESLIEKDNSDPIWNLSENTNSILIQLSLGEVIIWANSEEKRTGFQQQQLNQFINKVFEIKKKYPDFNIECSSAICKDGLFNKIDTESLLNQSDELTENGISK